MLHGEIKINDHVIGEWSAVREETIFKGCYWYECVVKYTNSEGYPKTVDFRLTHYEKMGALALTSQVISTAMRKMK